MWASSYQLMEAREDAAAARKQKLVAAEKAATAAKKVRLIAEGRECGVLCTRCCVSPTGLCS